MSGAFFEMDTLNYLNRLWLYILELCIQGFVMIQLFVGGTIYLVEGLHWLRYGKNDPSYRSIIYDGLYEPLSTRWIGLNELANEILTFIFSPLGSISTALGVVYFWTVALDKDLGDLEHSIWVYSPVLVVGYMLIA